MNRDTMEASLIRAGFIFAAVAGFLLLNGNLRNGVKEILKCKEKKDKKGFSPERSSYC